MAKKSLIALVATAVMVGGERQIIQPGQPLPDDIDPRDRGELLAARAARETQPAADAEAPATDPTTPASLAPAAAPEEGDPQPATRAPRAKK